MGNQIDMLDFEFENYDLTLQQLKGSTKQFFEQFLKNLTIFIFFLKKKLDLIYEEILYYHFKDFREAYDAKKKMGQSVYAHVAKNENSKIEKVNR